MKEWSDSLDEKGWDSSFDKTVPSKPILNPGKHRKLTSRWSAALHCYQALVYHVIFDDCDQLHIDVCTFEAAYHVLD
jgi:hypothetical protein